MFLLGLGLVVGMAVYTQANLLFWLFGLGVGGALFAWVHGRLASRGLHVERLPLSRAIAGDPLTLSYRLSNRGRFACVSLRVRELDEPATREGPVVLPWAWVPRVESGGAVQLSASGVTPPRGAYPLDRVEVSTTFPLGLFRRRKVCSQPATLQVLPVMPPLSPRTIRRAARPRPGPGGHTAGSRLGAEGDFYGSRAYRVGDPLRTLDWKRSARAGEFMVRELAAAEPSRVMVFLDLRGGQASAAGEEPGKTPSNPPSNPPSRTSVSDSARLLALQEKAIGVAASLVTGAHAAGFRVGLHVEGAACPAFTPHHALAHRDLVLGALCQIDLSAPAPPSSEAVRSRAEFEATVCVVADGPWVDEDVDPEAMIRPSLSPLVRSMNPSSSSPAPSPAEPVLQERSS